MREEFREKFEDYLTRLRANDPTLTTLCLNHDQIGDDGYGAIEQGLQHVEANKKMFSEDLLGGVSKRYHDLNKLSEEHSVLPPEVYLIIIRDLLSAILLVRGSIAEKLSLIDMSNLKDPKLPNKDESAYMIAKAFKKFTQGVEGQDTLGAEVVGPICANDSVLLEGFYQLHNYDERLGNGIIHLQESEKEGGYVKRQLQHNLIN